MVRITGSQLMAKIHSAEDKLNKKLVKTTPERKLEIVDRHINSLKKEITKLESAQKSYKSGFKGKIAKKWSSIRLGKNSPHKLADARIVMIKNRIKELKQSKPEIKNYIFQKESLKTKKEALMEEKEILQGTKNDVIEEMKAKKAEYDECTEALKKTQHKINKIKGKTYIIEENRRNDLRPFQQAKEATKNRQYSLNQEYNALKDAKNLINTQIQKIDRRLDLIEELKEALPLQV